MRITKKITAVFLVAIMLLAIPQAGFALTFSDVTENTKYGDAMTSMAALGLLKGYEDGSFKPENTITRAEFAAVMTRAIGMESMINTSSAREIFTDMIRNGSDHWATGYVKIAYDRGIILGMGDGTFAPDSPVTYEQAVKMIVCALGREAAAIDAGGWPGGYIAVANNIGLTDNAIHSPTNGPASRGIVAQLVYNALDIPLWEAAVGGDMVATSKTLLQDRLKVNSFKNMMVTEVDGVLSINPGASSVRNGQMLLESGSNVGIYNYTQVINSEEARNYLGHYVSGYYKVDTSADINNILMIKAASVINEEISIESDSIEGLSALELTYWKDKENSTRTDKITISPTAKLIYNGESVDYLSSPTPSKRDLTYWLDPSGAGFINGEARLLDSGADGSFDLLFVDDFETYVVKSPVRTNDYSYSNNYVVYDYYTSGRSIQIDPYDRNNDVMIYNAKTGREMNIEDVRSMDIMSVAASADGKTIKAYVSTDKFSGTIDSMSTSLPRKYYINNAQYQLTEEFAQAVSAGKVELGIGSQGMFYLDRTGKIAAATITAAENGNYCYITAAGKYDMTGNTAAIELIALKGEPSKPTKYEVAPRVKINDVTYTDVTGVLSALATSASRLASNSGASSATHSQLAKVIINSDNQITSITTAKTKTVGSSEVLDIGTSTNAGALKLGQENAEFAYSMGSGFESQVFIDSSTQVLVVPTSRRDADKYKRSVGRGYFAAGTRYTIEAYDMNASATAKVVIVYGADADLDITSDTPASLVIGCTETISSSSGQRVYSIEVYENGELKTYETEDSSSEYALEAGDIVRFGFNARNEINNVEVQVNTANLVARKLTGDGATDERGEFKFKSIMGTASSVVSDRIVIAPAFVDTTADPPTLNQNNREGYIINGNVKVYRVTLTGGGRNIEKDVDINTIVEYGDAYSNPDASKVYAYALSGELKMIVIYQ